VSVDPDHDEVVISDENLFGLRVYDRRSSVPGVAEPRRVISGPHTQLEFICGVAVDPRRREIYTVNNDTLDSMLVFTHEQEGDARPARLLKVDHGAWGVALDLEHDEVAITVQHTNQVNVYPRTAQGETPPLRKIQGPATGLADPHGIAVDTKNGEILVANHGAWHREPGGPRDRSRGRRDVLDSLRPSTGRFLPPSITVYGRTAIGDVAPLRKIEGPSTRLNLPAGMFVDVERDEIFVANDGGDSILVFRRTASGDDAPLRAIAGPGTGVKNPTGVFVDAKHDEVWVSNWGNHTASVYRRTANGNAAPIRVLRTAPPDSPVPGIGNPGAVAYDAGRDQLLVPN
jgi:DNA-binding beta-propeller fold protein YncE